MAAEQKRSRTEIDISWEKLSSGLVAAGFEHETLHSAAPYDLIFANILKGPLIELAPDMAAHSAQGGIVILSGLLVEQAEDVLAAYDANGFDCETREDIGEWSCLTLIKR